jgi:zinc protease
MPFMTEALSWLGRTERFLLPNGLTILTYKIPDSPATSLHFCVKSGYFCERDSEVGLAHLLEHMYFKGSERYPTPGTLGIAMKSFGGSINATTSYDQTNYFCEVPSNNLLPALQIMSDAFVAPLFPEDELTKECEVVIEEFNRKLDSPAAYSQEKLVQMSFTTHRIKRWRIGTPEQLRSYRQKDLFDYFHRYYQPRNMVVTVVGDFDQQQVVGAIQELLQSMKITDLVKDLGPEEPPQHGLRFASHTAATTTSYLHMALPAPGVLHPDTPLLELVPYLLSVGRSARFHRYVVEQKRSASSVSCSFGAYENVGLIFITAVTEPEKIREAGIDIWAVIDDLLNRGVAEEDLLKIKNKLRLYQAMQTEEVLSLAQLLSYYESYGGYERIQTDYDRMEEASQEDVLHIARKYFSLDHLNVLELVNHELPETSASEYERRISSGFVPPESVLAPPFIMETHNGTGTARDASAPLLIKSNIDYILQPDPHYPFISCGIFFSGGRMEEDFTTAGLTHLVYRTILKGTSRHTAEELAFRFDALGNPPRFSCYRDFSGFMFETLPSQFLQMWQLLMDCLGNPIFPEKEVAIEKEKMVTNIRRNLDDNFVRPMQLFQSGFYGEHPYGIPELGFEERTEKFSRDDVLTWKNRLISQSRATVAVVGNFDADILLPQMDAALGRLSKSGTEPAVPSVPHHAEAREVVELRPKKQTAFVLGFPAPQATNPKIHKYEAMQQVLSGMGGRLFLNLRSKQSLAYTVYAGTVAGRFSGAFITYNAGEASKEKQAIEGMWRELQKLKEEPVSVEELENARMALIGGYSLNLQTASSKVFDYQTSHALGRPIPFLPVYREHVQQITREDLLQVARETFREENSTIGIVRGTTEKTDAEKVISEE